MNTPIEISKDLAYWLFNWLKVDINQNPITWIKGMEYKPMNVYCTRDEDQRITMIWIMMEKCSDEIYRRIGKKHNLMPEHKFFFYFSNGFYNVGWKVNKVVSNEAVK